MVQYHLLRGISSAGRVPHWQCGCQRFESAMLHHFKNTVFTVFFFFKKQNGASNLGRSPYFMSFWSACAWSFGDFRACFVKKSTLLWFVKSGLFRDFQNSSRKLLCLWWSKVINIIALIKGYLQEDAEPSENPSTKTETGKSTLDPPVSHYNI